MKKKPNRRSHDQEEKRLGIMFSNLSAEIKEQFYVEFPNWIPVSENTNIRDINNWAKSNDGRKPNIRSSDPEEKRAGGAFKNLSTMTKEQFYAEFPNWIPLSIERNIISLRAWASVNGGRKPVRRMSDPEGKRLGIAFQNFPNEVKDLLYEEFGWTKEK